MNLAHRAVECFEGGFCCSQAILSTYGPRFGLDRETALKLATGFCGGMGRMAGMCGAVTAAFMVLGLKDGQSEVGDKESKQKTTMLVREFARQFKARHGTTLCRELLGCDISTDEGFQKAKDQGLLKACPKFVEDAATILDGML